MDVLNTYGLVFGAIIGLLSAGATFFNKKKLEGQLALVQAGNDELRQQNADLRLERTDLKSEVAACTARADEREKLLQEYKDQNLRLPDFAQLATVINNNHKEIMTILANAAVVYEKPTPRRSTKRAK